MGVGGRWAAMEFRAEAHSMNQETTEIPRQIRAMSWGKDCFTEAIFCPFRQVSTRGKPDARCAAAKVFVYSFGRSRKFRVTDSGRDGRAGCPSGRTWKAALPNTLVFKRRRGHSKCGLVFMFHNRTDSVTFPEVRPDDFADRSCQNSWMGWSLTTSRLSRERPRLPALCFQGRRWWPDPNQQLSRLRGFAADDVSHGRAFLCCIAPHQDLWPGL